MKKKIIISFLLFFSTFFIYKFIYPNPRNWYDHFKFLANSFLNKQVDIPNLPQFYHDKIQIEGRNYLPFPPVPAVILMPIVKFFPQTTQQQISILIGAINVVLIFFLLSKFTNLLNTILLSAFFAFGTVHFWSAVVGTTWYFAHIVALMFFLLSLIAFKNKKDFLAGIFFSLAVLSRYPMLLGIVFYFLELFKKKKRLISFFWGVSFFLPIQLIYNWLRFGNIFQTGYLEVYKNYINMNYPFTIMQLIKPGFPYFGYMDPRNIPLHIFTFLFMPPDISKGLAIMPSPYGMGILFSSPFLLLAFFPPFRKIQRNLILGAAAIALVDFLHYMQGWVQFGYRFLLDFLPFLIIILAFRFKPSKLKLLLLMFSILVNFWGVIWGIKLGW